ncbi:hypothetical protein FSP39_020197 [Pinctada imbricata]|uniref:XK-related protein n=1 Tax=Pinctada imbricata TaxID=66713 RepID=A0AA88Y8M2_PINIB|nr:hypothetical protein FSP39_020197 [Pinctada imbricata]
MVTASTFTMQIFSFHWHVLDKSVTWSILLVHLSFMAPFHRYVKVLQLSRKAMQTQKLNDLAVTFRANNDVCLLRLVQIFLQSAPQMILQLYIILGLHSFSWLQALSLVFSLFSMAWSLTAYLDGLRLFFKDNYNRKPLSTAVHTVWNMLLITARVVAIVLFTTHFHLWIILPIGIHWLISTCWVTVQNADFGDSTCQKRLLNTIAGYIYIFCFLNFKNSQSRCRLCTYHILVLAENTILVILWFHYKSQSLIWLDVFALCMVYGGFTLGGVMMMAYYACCHPTGGKPKAQEDDQLGWFRRLQNLQPKKKPQIFESQENSFRVAEWLNASVPLSNEANSRDVSRRPSMDQNGPSLHWDEYPMQFLSSRSPNPNAHALPSRTPSIESALNYFDKYLTIDSAKSSILSASSSTHRLLDSSKKCKLPWRLDKGERSTNFDMSYGCSFIDESYTEAIPYRDNSNAETKVHFPRTSSSYAFRDCPANSAGTMYAVTGSSSNSTEVKNDDNSFCQSPEFTPIKRLSLSPLDPVKLWESTMQGSYHLCPLSDSAQASNVTLEKKNINSGMYENHQNFQNSSSGHETSSFQDYRNQSRSTSDRSTEDSGYSNLHCNPSINFDKRENKMMSDVSVIDSTVSSIHTANNESNIENNRSRKNYSLSVPLLDQIQSYCRKDSDSFTFISDTSKSTINAPTSFNCSKPGSTKSSLPGLSYLMDISDVSSSFAEMSNNVNTKEESPVALSINNTRCENETSQNSPLLLDLNKMMDLTESPYKFRFRNENQHKKTNMNPLLPNIYSDLENLNESPYKFRYKGRESDRRSRTMNSSADKENMHPFRRANRKRSSKRRLSSPTLERATFHLSERQTKPCPTYKHDGGVRVGKVSQIKNSHKASRNNYDRSTDSGYKTTMFNTSRNSTPTDRSVTDSDITSSVNYSTNSHHSSTDDSDIVIDYTRLKTPTKSCAPPKGRLNERQALQSLENLPPLSPIDHVKTQRRQAVPSYLASTPMIDTEHESSYSVEDVAPLRIFDEPSIVNV